MFIKLSSYFSFYVTNDNPTHYREKNLEDKHLKKRSVFFFFTLNASYDIKKIYFPAYHDEKI